MTAIESQPGLVHEALVYSTDEEFNARLVPFFREGLAAGQPALAILTRKKVELLRDALGRDAARVIFIDAGTHYRRPAHALAEFRRRLDAELGQPDCERARIVGELPFTQSADGQAEWIRYESVVNHVLAGYPVWIVCGYDTRALSDDIIADALRTHPLVTTGGRRGESSAYIAPDAQAERPSPHGATRTGSRDPLVRISVRAEEDLDDLRRVVSRAARAAGLAPTLVGDVAVAVCELARDGLRHGAHELAVEVTREGARLHCDVVERESDRTSLGERIGPTIARLISDDVELASGADSRSIRLTFTGAAAARQRILDAASELFYQGGIRTTGINTIISYSGVAKATFFHHFASKDDLVLAWLKHPASRWFDRIRAELDAGSEPPAKRLLRFFDLLGDWFAQEDFRGCAFQNAAAETPEAADPVRQETHSYALEIQRYLQRTASDAGLARPARLAEQLHVLAQGAIATAVTTRSPDAASVARAAAAKLIAA